MSLCGRNKVFSVGFAPCVGLEANHWAYQPLQNRWCQTIRVELANCQQSSNFGFSLGYEANWLPWVKRITTAQIFLTEPTVSGICFKVLKSIVRF